MAKKEYRVTIKVDIADVKAHGIIGDPDTDEDWSAEENIEYAIQSAVNDRYKEMGIVVTNVVYDDYPDTEETSTNIEDRAPSLIRGGWGFDTKGIIPEPVNWDED